MTLLLVHTFSAHQQRKEMDRQRLEAAHLKYACLMMANKYPEAIDTCYVKMEGPIMDTLSKSTPILFNCFESRYAGWFLHSFFGGRAQQAPY